MTACVSISAVVNVTCVCDLSLVCSDNDKIVGAQRWQGKLWKLVGQLLEYRSTAPAGELTEEEKAEEQDYVELLNECIKKVVC